MVERTSGRASSAPSALRVDHTRFARCGGKERAKYPTPELLSVVAMPDPHERVRERLVEDFPVAVPGRFAEDKSVMISLRRERC